MVYTDGGPDHNVKFLTVWLSLVCLFLHGDLDLLIAMRTCPTQSWKNVVEKIMCVLNLALYGVTLVRSAMGDEMEQMIGACNNSMASIRQAASCNQELQDACMASVQPVKDLLHSRFEKLSLKDEAFTTFGAASEDELISMLSHCALIDSSIPKAKTDCT